MYHKQLVGKQLCKRYCKKDINDLLSPKTNQLSEKEANVIQFEPKVCYSLNPEKFSDMSIGSDIDSVSLFQK